LEERPVEEVKLLWPGVEEILERHGIDTCCGGMHSLGDADWQAMESGPERWVVRITRVAEE